MRGQKCDCENDVNVTLLLLTHHKRSPREEGEENRQEGALLGVEKRTQIRQVD